jgi:hypothetical protein
MQNHSQKENITQKIQDINLGLLELQNNPGFSNAQEIIIQIVQLFGVQVPERGRFSFVKDSKFIKNEPWFLWHEVVTDKRAAEILKHEEGVPIEIKTYWVNKIASDRIKGIVHFSDNYEDNKRTRDDDRVMVGIDFIVHPKGDAITIALSNNGNVRVLELKGKLNNTQKKIFASWIEIAIGEQKKNREYLHSSLWNSFELKSVNQDFYDIISRAFVELKDHFDTHKILPQEESKKFANRLLSRLLFVWFLRKKDFISEQKISYFDTENLSDTEYYFTKLEKLFFETLNKPFELRDALNDDLKTPYLNGGLFHKQKSDTIDSKATFPSSFFARLYRNLDEYNFTTDESTPDFEQVAIDPEMLGRVFENLLASMSEETGEQARKAKGAFYTPREIVQYMCRETLRTYLYTNLDESNYKLEIDRLIDTPDFEWANNESNKTRDISNKGDFGKKAVQALEKLKTIDPACGSGAFPIGMLQELMRIYGRLTRTANEYEIKLKILENNIYGVDIEPMAVEISRLRAFLALVVDQEYNEKNKNGGIDTLPNLEFKFVCANSLISLDQQGELYDGLTSGKKAKVIDLEKELTEIKKKYFKADYLKKKELEDKLDNLLGTGGMFESKKYQQLRTYHPIKQISPASFYEPKLMHDVENNFDVVIGNPPYVSTKGVKDVDKKEMEKQFGFADDLYSHFYFKGLDLCNDGGILSYITSKTFWTIQTKKNVRELLLNNNIITIYDTANPFQSAMVDTCVISVQKNTPQSKDIQFLKVENDYAQPISFSVPKEIYKNAVNNVFFIPTTENLSIYTKYNPIVKKLIDEWWTKINTSKNITKYQKELQIYRNNLQPGDVTLLGLITDGGQGLATANNGKYVGVLEGTKEAIKTKEARNKKFIEFVTKAKITEYGFDKVKIQSYLNGLSEQETRKLFDELKEKHGRDIFGQGFLSRIVSKDEIKDVREMTDEEKKNGLTGSRTYVPYDKGDKNGNRWYLRTPYYIDWSIENVSFLKQDSKARYQGYQFYFRAGFCWILTLNEQSEYQKARIKEAGVFDVNAMSLFSEIPVVSEKYLICLLNSYLLFRIKRNFINGSSAFQINDARQLPIIIPNQTQLTEFESIFDRAYEIKNDQFDGKMTNVVADQKLQEIQKELDKKVLKLYELISEEI